MIKTIITRLKQGYRTQKYPVNPCTLSDRYLGRPVIDEDIPNEKYRDYVDICPTMAISIENNKLVVDMGKCLFCGECQKLNTKFGITFSKDYKLACFNRENLKISNITNFENKRSIEKLKNKNIFNRSLKLRQVCAGGCNACEADINVLSTIGFDLGRFGISFVASPRHADGIVVTGPVTNNMKGALIKTYDAIPGPKVVIAVGSCAVSGGPYMNHDETNNGIGSILPVDLYIPGCPPHPLTILDGLLKIMGRSE